MRRLTPALRKRFERVKFVLLDVDGVLTDGRIIYDSRGHDAKSFDVHDGLGVWCLGRMGIKTILITAKKSKAIKPRAADMSVEAVYAEIHPKTKAYAQILKKYRLKDRDVCFVGDDLVDLCVLKKAGLAIAPANAVDEVKRSAHYVTRASGGRGAVREVAELILKSQGLWKGLLRIYR